MRITAYVLVADPNYLRESLLSYYDHVDRIVLSYDENATSWTGTPIPVAECLAVIDDLDVDGKCERMPGHFARLEHHPLENETYQRQLALDEAGKDADWVLQLDTDEVMLDPPSSSAHSNEPKPREPLPWTIRPGGSTHRSPPVAT